MNIRWNKSDHKDYLKAKREYLERYSRIDDVLYDMCKKMPNHNKLREIQAKVVIIGRTYATGLERRGGGDNQNGILEKVADIFFKNRVGIDLSLKNLRRVKSLSIQSGAKEILIAHGAMVKLLRKETEVNFRSFVSKYLHFHIPVVPIFDSRASGVLNNWYPWREFQISPSIRNKRGYDEIYIKFLLQFLFYFEGLKKLKLGPSVRNADYFLIWSAS